MVRHQDAIDPLELHRLLLQRTAWLRTYIAAKIPAHLKSTIQTEDIANEVYMAAYQRIAEFRPNGPDAAERWLKTITHHVLMNMLRRAQSKKRAGHMVRQPLDRTPSYLDLWAALASPERTPSSAAAKAEASESLRIALATLPDDRRQVVSLHYLEGRSYAEIAAATGRTESSVRGLLMRSLEQLRGELGRASKYLSDAPSSDAAAQ